MFGQSQSDWRAGHGDHFEGQTEGQNAAGEGLRELVAASLS